MILCVLEVFSVSDYWKGNLIFRYIHSFSLRAILILQSVLIKSWNGSSENFTFWRLLCLYQLLDFPPSSFFSFFLLWLNLLFLPSGNPRSISKLHLTCSIVSSKYDIAYWLQCSIWDFPLSISTPHMILVFLPFSTLQVLYLALRNFISSWCIANCESTILCFTSDFSFFVGVSDQFFFYFYILESRYSTLVHMLS